MSEVIRIEIPVEMLDKTEPAMSNITGKITRLGDTARKTGQTVSKFDTQTQKTEKSLQSWVRQKYQVVLDAKDKVGPILSGIGSNLKSFAGKTWNTTLSVLDLATKPIQGIISLLRNPILQAGAVLGISVSAADTINTYKDFEAQMSQVKAISGASGSDYERLNKKAQEMGATTKFTATEAAQGFNYMAMAGWNTDQMEAGISGILSLAAASGEDLGTTSDIVTDALTAFNMSADDATRFADVLAVASSNANTNVAMMGETFKYVGAASGALGYSIEDVALGIGLMANAGIKSSQAGTELNSIFTRLSTNTNGARDAIESLGISFYDQNGNARDFGKVLDELRGATKGMNNEQKINLANTIAGQRAQAGLLAMLNASEADYRKVTTAIRDADGAAADMADTMLDNLSGSITKLQSAWEGLKLKLGERLSPYIKEFAEWLTAQTPKIADAIGNVMDKVDRFAQKMKDRWKDLTGSSDWANADFLGKLKLSWDKMIIEPLTEWWEGGGKARVAHFAGEFGNFLGSALNMGIMGLFGFDAGGAIDEGASIGKSFAKGFADGFDFKAVASKVLEGIKNIFKSALKLLPGGEKAGLSSILSAGLLGVGAVKLASPLSNLVQAGIGVGKLTKTVFGKGQDVYKMGSDGTLTSVGTTGLGLGSKLLGLGSNVYAAGGSGLLSGVGASAAGLGAVAGGAIAGGTLISGGMDVYRAIKADDEKARAAYAKSAGWKIGGTAAGAAGGAIATGLAAAGSGAAAGAAAGSVVPVVGTLIGAGIGAVGGLIMGNIEKKKYEEEMARLEARRAKTAEVYKLTGIELDKVTFKTKELNEALEDSEMSAEEFSYLVQNDMQQKATRAFGSIKLSLSEVKSLAENITVGKSIKSFEEYAKAATETQAAYEAFADAQSTMSEMTWKVGLGMELSEGDISDFRSSVDSFVESAKTYVEKNHYEASLGMKLIMGDSADTKFIDEYYAGVQTRIAELSKELDNRIEIALQGDYRIDTDEAKGIQEIQDEITEITNKFANAQQEAQLEAIKLKYGGADLDYESFTMLQEELNNFKQEAEASLESGYITARTSLQLAYDDAETEEARAQIQAQIDELDSDYMLQLNEVDVRVGTFELETIATAWNEELEIALSGLEGTTQEKLSTVLNNALAVKPEVTAWDTNEIISWFGLDKIGDSSTAALIAEQIRTMASHVSEQSKATMTEELKNAVPSQEELMSALNFDFGSFEEAGGIFAQVAEGVQHMIADGVQNSVTSERINEAFSGLELGQKFQDAVKGQEISENLKTALESELSEAQLFETLATAMQAQAEGVDVLAFMEPLKSKFDEMGVDIPERLKEALNNNFANVNLFETLGEVMLAQSEGVEVGLYLEPLLAKFREAEINLDGFAANLSGSLQEQFINAMSAIDLSGGTEILQANVQTAVSGLPGYATSAVQNLDFAGTGSAVTSGVGSAISSADMSPINSAVSTLKSNTDGRINAAFSAGVSTRMPVNVTLDYNVLNPTKTFTVTGEGGGAASLTVSAHAMGGYVSGGPQLSWLAEEGWGEYIIPTNPSRRDDALRLWSDAGRALGVQEHAAGGYVSGAFDTYEDDEPQETYSPDSGANNSSNDTVTVNLNMTPSININGASDPEAILDALRGELATMTNEMSATLAGQLKEVLTNIPHRKGAA